MNLTFYIHHTIHTESISGFGSDFPENSNLECGSVSESEKCSLTSDPLHFGSESRLISALHSAQLHTAVQVRGVQDPEYRSRLQSTGADSGRN